MKSISIKSIILTGVTSILLIVCIIQCTYMHSAIRTQIADNMTYLASNTVNGYAQEINQYLSSLENLGDTLSRSNLLKRNWLTLKKNDFSSQNAANNTISSYLENLAFSYKGVVGIPIFTNNLEYYNYYSNFGFYNIEHLNNDTLRNIMNSDSSFGFTSVLHNNIILSSSVDSLFAYYTRISYDSSDQNKTGMPTILIDCNVFKDVVVPTLSTNEKILILAGDELIFPRTDPTLSNYADYIHLSSGTTLTLNKEPFLYLTSKLKNGWQMVNLIPMEHTDDSTRILTLKIILCSISALIFCFLFLNLFSRHLCRSLEKLIYKMQHFKIFRDTTPINSSITEIIKLDQNFQDMTNRLDILVEQIKEEQYETGKAQLELLRSQINPHFLYNTLDVINWMAIDRDAEDISQMVSNLASMFRHSLNMGMEMSTINDELNYLYKYIDIQKYRYSGRFTYEEDLDVTLLKHEVPCIILQPFVENALLHGLKSIHDSICIKLILERKNDTIVFTIQDDGCGCDISKMNQYLDAEKSPQKGFGVRNIHRRIQLHYGAAFGVSYEPVSKGTKVKICIPVKEVTFDEKSL